MKKSKGLTTKNFILLIFLSSLIMTACEKEETEALEEYTTEMVWGNFETTVEIGGSYYDFHGGNSYFYSSYPGLKYPNQFSFYLTDTTQEASSYININIPIGSQKPESFFKVGSILSDYIKIEYSFITKSGEKVKCNGFYENADIEFIWHDVSFTDNKYRGKGSLIIKDFLGPIADAPFVLSPQVISVEY